MSLDSESSHSSAQNDEDGATDITGGHQHVGDTPQFSHRQTTPNYGRQDEEDDEADELESIDSGSHGFTFARVRSRGTQQEEETASELSIRPRVERPGSPESTSTPDDTPSIQVRPISAYHGSCSV